MTLAFQLIPGRFCCQPGRLLWESVGVILGVWWDTRANEAFNGLSQQMLSVATVILWLFSTNKDSVMTLFSDISSILSPSSASFSNTFALTDFHFLYVKCFFKVGEENIDLLQMEAGSCV